MSDQTLRCTVITPEAEVYDGPARSVVIPAHDGQIGILVNRAPLLCKLGFGRLSIRRRGTETSWYIDAGFAQVLDNHVTILTQRALRSEEIDRSATEAALEEARRLPVSDDTSARRKEQAVARARAQLRMIE